MASADHRTEASKDSAWTVASWDLDRHYPASKDYDRNQEWWDSGSPVAWVALDDYAGSVTAGSSAEWEACSSGAWAVVDRPVIQGTLENG